MLCFVCRAQDAPLYPFAHGLSYTTFAALDMHVAVHAAAAGSPDDPGEADPAAPTMFAAHDVLTVRVTVANTGTRDGEWPVLLFVGDDACIAPPPPPMLRGFEKVRLRAGDSTAVTFKVRRCRKVLARERPDADDDETACAACIYGKAAASSVRVAAVVNGALL